MSRRCLRACFVWSVMLLVGAQANRGLAAPANDCKAIATRIAAAEEGAWQKVATSEPFGSMGSRWLFAYALALCQIREHPERLERLFELGCRAQDRDPQSPHYGNLKWTWRDAGVTDGNAVEFCAHDALRIWLKHKDWLPEPARQMLREWLDYSIGGCLGHRVPVSYTNIAVLNAGNLIVLGEAFNRPEVAEEGYRRLEAICLWTWQFGTHEYCSPTYYSVDLNGLAFMKEFAARELGRRQAAALGRLFWTDIALNWFPPAAKLAGPHSRSYDYVRGLGSLDGNMALCGWLKGIELDGMEAFHAALGQGILPPPGPREIDPARFPRLIRQSWGLRLTESRTHMMYRDVTLGCSAAAYSQHDMPLTVDLPGDRRLPRCYFIADGREDPYGQKKYGTGSAKHLKALHLQPFWAGAQRNRDALGLVIYRPEDLSSPEITNVQSHFVLRRDVAGFWLRGQRLQIPPGTGETPGRVAIEQGQPLVMRCGTAAVGIRLLWARRQNGQPAAAALVNDGNRQGVLRLTVDHRSAEVSAEAGAAFWVRIGSGLQNDTAFHEWRRRFEKALPATVEADNQSVRLAVPGEDGPVAISASRPYGRSEDIALQPPPSHVVLELNGKEIGRPLLETVEPIRSYRHHLRDAQPLVVPAEGSVTWEAEDGVIFPGMVAGHDDEASGRQFVWQPPDTKVNHLPGSVFFPLSVAKAGRYYLWGRASASDPTADSMFVRVIGQASDIVPRKAWHMRRAEHWLWQRVSFERSKEPTPLKLPSGRCLLELQVREPGARIDRLMLTAEEGLEAKD